MTCPFRNEPSTDEIRLIIQTNEKYYHNDILYTILPIVTLNIKADQLGIFKEGPGRRLTKIF